MSLDIQSLKLAPNALKKGKTTVAVSYQGVIDAASSNPVNLRLFIEPAAPAFVIVDGAQQKEAAFQETFTTKPKSFSKSFTIEITRTPGMPTSVSIRLEAVDAKGNRSAKNSFIIYS